MKHALIALCFTLTLAACGRQKKDKTSSQDPLTRDNPPPEKLQDSLKERGRLVLLALKNNDPKVFSRYFSPTDGTRFSPYGFVDTVHSKKLLAEDFLRALEQQKTLNWGSYDGTGEPIELSVQAYLKKFVYNADYLNAERTGYDEIIGKGNTLINLQNIYPGMHFIEYHFAGFNPQYQGMDWSSLRLVFKKEINQYFLIAVIHDQWTI